MNIHAYRIFMKVAKHKSAGVYTSNKQKDSSGPRYRSFRFCVVEQSDPRQVASRCCEGGKYVESEAKELRDVALCSARADEYNGGHHSLHPPTVPLPFTALKPPKEGR